MKIKWHVCDICGRSYYAEFDHEELKKEFEKNFPNHDVDDRDMACNVCYKKFMEWHKGEGGSAT